MDLLLHIFMLTWSLFLQAERFYGRADGSKESGAKDFYSGLVMPLSLFFNTTLG